MKNVKLLYWILFILLCSCKSDNKETIETIHIKSQNKERISNLFDSINIIFLETCDSSLVGQGIERCEIYKNRFYILNRLTSRSNILCFDTSGDFMFCIDKMGNGPGEYNYLGDFFIDESLNEIVLRAERGRQLYFDLDGKFLYEKNKPDESYIRQNIFLNDSTYIAYNDSELPPQGYNLIEYDSRTLVFRDTSKVIKDVFGDLGILPLTVYGPDCFYYNIKDTIYEITNIKFPVAKYCINWGADIKRLKDDLFHLNEINHSSSIEQFVSHFNKNEMPLVGSFFINDSWVSFNILNSSQNRNNDFKYSVSFYNKSSKKSYHSGNIDFDYLNIPLINNDIRIIACNDEKIFLLLDNDFIENNIIEINNSSLPQSIKKTLLDRTIEDNPIIMELSSL